MAHTFNQFSANDADEITPHDTNPNRWDAIYVGGTGNITLVTEAGTTVVFATIPAGTIIPVRTSIIKATGTSATTLVGLRSV